MVRTSIVCAGKPQVNSSSHTCTYCERYWYHIHHSLYTDHPVWASLVGVHFQSILAACCIRPHLGNPRALRLANKGRKPNRRCNLDHCTPGKPEAKAGWARAGEVEGATVVVAPLVEMAARSCNADAGRSPNRKCRKNSCASGVCHMCYRPDTCCPPKHCRIMATRPALHGWGTQCYPPD